MGANNFTPKNSFIYLTQEIMLNPAIQMHFDKFKQTRDATIISDAIKPLTFSFSMPSSGSQRKNQDEVMCTEKFKKFKIIS